MEFDYCIRPVHTFPQFPHDEVSLWTNLQIPELFSFYCPYVLSASRKLFEKHIHPVVQSIHFSQIAE